MITCKNHWCSNEVDAEGDMCISCEDAYYEMMLDHNERIREIERMRYNENQ